MRFDLRIGSFGVVVKGLAALGVLVAASSAHAQTTVSLTTTSYTQDFNAITTATTATLPTGWMFSSGTGPLWSGTGNSLLTTKDAGLSGTGALTTSSGGGSYLFVDGILATGTDKAIGFLTSSSYTSPRSILFGFTNNTGSNVSSLLLGWDYEKYRNGARAFDWKFYGSADGTAWTSFSGGDKSYAADGATAVISSVVTSSVSPFSIGASITSGASYYFRWDYVGSGGSSNAQALGIDNFSLSTSGSSVPPPPPPATTGLFWDANGTTAGVGGTGTWTTSGSTFATTVDGTAVGTLASTGNVAFAGTAGTVTVGGAVAPPSGLTFSTTGYTVTGGTIALSGSASSTITTDSGVTATLNSVLTQAAGSAAIVKAGAGSLALGGDNSYAGGTTISVGTLTAASNTALGTGGVTVTNGTLLAASGVTLANAITVAASGTGGGAGAFVAGWDFQTAPGTIVTSSTGSPVTPNVYQSNFGSGTFLLNGTLGSSVWTSGTIGTELNGFSGSTVNAGVGFSTTTTSPAALALIAGAASGSSFTANGKSAVFTVDMTGKQDLTISLAEQRTASGFTSEAWAYSTDGTNWTTFQTLGTADIPTSFGLITLNSISALNNVSTAYVKMTLDGATNSSGNVRLDNIQFNASVLGTAVTAAATIGTDVVGGITEFAGPIALGGSANLSAATDATVIFSGTISGGGGIRKVGDGTVVLTQDERYTGGTTVEAGQVRLGAGGGTGSVTGAVQLLAPGSSLVIDRSDDLTFSNAVSGSGAFFKEGGNTVTVTSENSYTGGTTLFAGSLVVGDGGTHGSLAASGPLDLASGTELIFDRSDDITFSGAVAGDGMLTQRGAGMLTLSQTGAIGNAFTLRVADGLVNLNRSGQSLVGILGAGNTVELAGGTLQLTSDAGEETKFTGAAIRVGADSTLAIDRTGAAGDHVTTGFDVPITIGNASTLTLDYRGAFSSNSLPAVAYKATTTYTGAVTLESSAEIAVTNSSGGTAEVILAGPVVDGGDGFDLTKSGDQRLTLAGVNTYGGSTFVNAGTLALGVNGSIDSSPVISVAAGATFDVSAKTNGYAIGASQSLGGNGTVAGSIAVGSGATVSPGASLGTLTVTQGVTWASGGNYDWQILDATGAAGAVGGWDLLDAGGTLTIASTAANPFMINLWSLSGAGPDVNGQARNFDATQNFTWKIANATGGISGFAANKFQVNTSAFNDAAGFANGLAGGSFSVAQNGNEIDLVFTKAGSGGPITINVPSGSQTQTQAGYAVLAGTTPVVKTGAGAVVLDQANTLTGATTVQAGTLRLANADALSSSAVTVAAGATLSVSSQVHATVAGLSNLGLVDVGQGQITVAGGLSAGDVFNEIVSGFGDGSWNGSSGITSSDNAVLGGTRAVGLVDNGDGSVAFGFAAQGDTDLNGTVDLGDLLSILGGGKYGTGLSASWQEGDFNYDGVSDLNDLIAILGTGAYGLPSYNTPAILRSRLSLGDPLGPVGSFSAQPVAVPEPSAAMLVAFAAASLVGAGAVRRRRNRRPGESA